LVVFILALPAPYIACRLIRRNRCLGRDIYRELAQADRFMQVWIAETPLASTDEQYIWTFIPNRNPAAAHYSKIDDQLAKLKLVERYADHGTYDSVYFAKPRRGKYLLRNWLIFLLLLWLRMTIFGDRPSHIASGNGRFDERTLKRMYWETTTALIVLALSVVAVILRFI
jgi:hypothetical protein